MKLYLLLPVILLLTYIVNAQNTSVYTQHNDLNRSGWNNRETKLTTTNVNAQQFGKAFSLSVDGQVYAQPLVVSGMPISGGIHNVVFIATVNNSVYAYDGDNGTLYWQKNYTAAGQRPPRNTDMTGACGGFYQDFSGQIGIVGTPVIDSASQIIYFVARSTNGSGAFVQYLHAVNLVDGSEMAGSPVKIAATCKGSGDGNVNNVLSFDAQHNNQRQALTLVNGIVYVTFSSHCDWQPYHGWILGYNSKTLTQKIVYNDTPDGYEAGLWCAGGGPAADAQGNLYVVTGNGAVGENNDPTNVVNRGESALKLTPNDTTLTVASYYTPDNYQMLENGDLDYGSMGAFLLPNSNFYFTGCKDGNIYLLNRDNMGGYLPNTNKVQQNISLGGGRTLRAQPAYFKGLSTEYVYVWSENDPLRAFPFNRGTNTFDVANQVISSASGPLGGSGAELSVSSNGGKDGTGIVWAAYASNGDANQSVRPGILRAFDANNITTELWNNQQIPDRDNAGNFAKFVSPTIANGHVYLPTFSNEVAVYGVIDSAVANACPVVDLALNRPTFSSSNQTTAYPPAYATDGNSTTRWSSMYSDPQWIYVDLGQVDSVCRVILNWETALGANFQIQVSNDAQNWTTAATITGNQDFLNDIGISAKGRYVRMYGTARGTPYGYSLYQFTVNGKALPTCLPPDTLSYNSATVSSAVLKWSNTGASSYVVQYRTATSNQYKTVTASADSISLTGLGCSTNYVWQVASVCSGVTSTFSNQSFFNTLDCTGCGVLPTRVYSGDVGNVGLSGEACYTAEGMFSVKGSGSDIYNNADQFRYVYKTFAADGTLQAKITSQDQTNPWNKAGLMFRATTDSTSSNILVAITSGNGVALQSRPVAGGPTGIISVPGPKAPYFLRLVKQGSVYTGYSSPDSSNWTQLATSSSNMANNGPINGGLAVSSHDNTQLSAVQFDQTQFVLYADSGVNIALNKPSYGSNYSDLGHTGAFGNDGDTSTYWSSLAGTGPQWYYIDLGQPFHLDRLGIKWGQNYAANFQVQTSADAASWTTVQQITGNTILKNTLIMNDSARFIRLYCTKSANNGAYSINEMQVYGDTIANNTVDIARGKPATSSSNAGTAFTADKAFDGDFTTRWASAVQADPQWVYVDLGAVYTITNVNITWELDAAKNFNIQVSNDGANWVTIKQVSNNTAYDNFIPVDGMGRYLRILGTARDGGANYSIYDLQVLGVLGNSKPVAPAQYNIDKFIVYPNPNTGQFVINFQSLVNQNIQLQISTITGKTLKKEQLNNFSGTYSLTTNLSDVPAGSYVITLRTPKGMLSKIVIKL